MKTTKKLFIFRFSLFALVVATLALAGCSKDRTCRCSVLHSSKTRVIKISSGTCEDIKVFTYHDPLDSLKVDSLLCTDHEFAVDATY